MDPLQAVEISWVMWIVSPHVIYNIFFEVPYPISVKKVAAFMYGNGFPIDIAVKCFNACNGQFSYFVSQTMSKWYSIWDKHPHRKHKAEYYSMFSNVGYG